MITYTSRRTVTFIARVAQLVERDLAKVEAAGSSPVSRSNEKGSSGRMVLFRSGISIETGRPARGSEGARGVTLFSPVSRSVKGLENLGKKVVRPQRIFNAGSHLCAIIIPLLTWNIQVFPWCEIS